MPALLWQSDLRLELSFKFNLVASVVTSLTVTLQGLAFTYSGSWCPACLHCSASLGPVLHRAPTLHAQMVVCRCILTPRIPTTLMCVQNMGKL